MAPSNPPVDLEPVDDAAPLPSPAYGGHGSQAPAHAYAAGSAATAPRKKTSWWVIVLALAGLSVPAGGVFSALAIYGARKYVMNAKEAEARQVLPAFARAIAKCANASRRLPSTSAAVPQQLAVVAGTKYQSASDDWTADETLACAGFTKADPQYFQYQWVLDGPTSGQVRAVSDLDGDHQPDKRVFTVEVRCAPDGVCQAGAEVVVNE